MEDWKQMIPDEYTSKMRIPVSFDVKKRNTRNYLAIFSLMFIIFVVMVLITIGWILSDRMIFTKLLIIIPWYLVIFIYRFFVFKEGKMSDSYETQKENDFKTPLIDIWDIYEIEDRYPYVAHYNNNNKGVFLKFKKDVIQGKPDNVETEHYDGIATALQKARELDLHVIYLDYMDNVGNDDRLDKLYEIKGRGSNPDLNNIMLQVISNLKEIMNQQYSSFDVVLLYKRTTADDLKYRVSQVIEEFKSANYKAVGPMNDADLKVLAKELYNLQSFSIMEAEKAVLDTNKNKANIIIPIEVKKDGVTTKLNLTSTEIREKKEREKQEHLERIENNKKQKAKQQQMTKSPTEEVEQIYGEDEVLFDIFSDDKWNIGKADNKTQNEDTFNLFGNKEVIQGYETGSKYSNLHTIGDQPFVTQEELDERKARTTDEDLGKYEEDFVHKENSYNQNTYSQTDVEDTEEEFSIF